LLSNIAVRNDNGEYTGAGDQTLVLWPGSAAVAKKPKWLVAAELVETTRRFARVVGPINPDWVERLAGDLVKRSHSDPQWERAAGAAMAWERVTLYGLAIVPRRRCKLAPFDPVKARELFIQHALVEGDYQTGADYHDHNLRLKEELRGWQAKLRKTQLFASEEQQFLFFDQRVPPEVVDSRSFERWRKTIEAENPRILFLSKEDLLVDPEAAVSSEAFPDQLQVGGVTAQVEYRLEPGSPEDGLTLVMPAEAIGRVSSARLGWLIPGLLEEKVESLIKTLPKELRRLFVPINETARAVIPRLRFGEGDLIPQIADVLRQLSGEHVPVEAFETSRLAGHLNFRVRAVDAAGNAVAETGDLNALQQLMKGKTAATFQSLAKRDDRWNRDGFTGWTFGELPEMVELTRGAASVLAHPMLVDQGSSVALRLSEDPEIAERQTRRALVRFFSIAAGRRIEQQTAWLPKLETWLAQGASILAAVDAISPAAGAVKRSSKAYANDFRRQIAYRIAERSCDGPLPLPRSERDYQRWLKTSESRLSVAAQMVTELLEPVVARGREVQKQLLGKPQAALSAAQADAGSQWSVLFAPEFFAETSWTGLQHYPRYLEALSIRWNKLLAGGLAKDRDLMVRITPFWNRYCEIVRKRPEVTAAFEPVRWLLEEYRVSLFAQQLRTPVPVSEKRIREAWDVAIKAATR
jgi:ATP-dependent helicase HrpA